MRIWEIPESSRRAKGAALVNFLNIGQSETIQAFLTLDAVTLDEGKGFVVFGTEKGRIKKTSLTDYANIRTSGITAIRLADDDALVYVRLSSGSDDIMMVTSEGQSIRFSEKDARPMGRVASGVTGIKVKKKDDYVVGMVVLPNGDEKDYLLVVSEKGYGKKSLVSEYKLQNRGGSGIKTYKVGAKTGNLVNARIQLAGAESDMLISTTSGQVIRLDAADVPELGRDTLGVRLIKLSSEKDKVASVAKIEEVMDEGEDEE